VTVALDSVEVAGYALVALLGLAVGSFLNVVIWRVPRGESIVSPPSACPSCGHAIRPRDNVPVLSWLVLRGRCRDCGQPISARYPLVEAGTGVLFLGVAALVGFDAPEVWSLPAFLYLAAISVALTLIDLETRTLPNAIVLPSYVVALVLLTVAAWGSHSWDDLVRALLGCVILYAFYFALVFAYPKGMGFGDVKLAGILGLYLGWIGWGALAVGAFAGFVVGGVFSLVLIVMRRAGRKSTIPFGPWMIIGAAIGLVFGEQIFDAYLSAAL
jgi:leader peptidase (prepilin peptidase)/N-methyltransferase